MGRARGGVGEGWGEVGDARRGMARRVRVEARGLGRRGREVRWVAGRGGGAAGLVGAEGGGGGGWRPGERVSMPKGDEGPLGAKSIAVTG